MKKIITILDLAATLILAFVFIFFLLMFVMRLVYFVYDVVGILICVLSHTMVSTGQNVSVIRNASYSVLFGVLSLLWWYVIMLYDSLMQRIYDQENDIKGGEEK